MNKKASSIFILVTIIISILSFFVIFNYLKSTTSVVTTTEDLACRSLVSVHENKVVHELGKFTEALNLKCKVDELEKKDLENKDEVYGEIAEYMARCWYRYGEGKKDFLGNFETDGNWCFTCAKLNLEMKEKKFNVLPYYSREGKKGSLLDWLENNKIELNNGSQLQYSDYLRIKYSDMDSENYLTIRDEINQLIEEDDTQLQPLVASMMSENLELLDLANKEIKLNEEFYVVYRYDRLNKDGDDILSEVIGNVAKTIGTEFAIETAATAGFGLIATAPKAIFSSVKAMVSINKYWLKISKIFAKLGEATKFSKKIKILDNIDDFSGGVGELYNLGRNLEKIDIQLADKIKDMSRTLDSLGIKNLDDISTELLKKEKDLDKFSDSLDDLVKSDLTKTDLYKEVSKSEDLMDEIIELEKISDELKPTLAKGLDTLSEPEKISFYEKSVNYIRGLSAVMLTTSGGIIYGNYNENYIQYVDIMNKEQYYRSCGLEPGLE